MLRGTPAPPCTAVFVVIDAAPSDDNGHLGRVGGSLIASHSQHLPDSICQAAEQGHHPMQLEARDYRVLILPNQAKHSRTIRQRYTFQGRSG